MNTIQQQASRPTKAGVEITRIQSHNGGTYYVAACGNCSATGCTAAEARQNLADLLAAVAAAEAKEG